MTKTLPEQFLIPIILGVIFLFFVGYRLFLEELYTQKNDLKQQFKQYQLTAMDKKNRLKGMMDKAVFNTSSTSTFPILMNKINQLASANHVNLLSMHRSEPSEELHYIKTVFYLDLSGSYQQLVMFIKKWVSSQKNVLLENCLIETNDKRILTMHLQLSNYRIKT